MENTERIERVREMEARMDRVLYAAAELEQSRANWEAARPPLEVILACMDRRYGLEETGDSKALTEEELLTLMGLAGALQQAQMRWKELLPDRKALGAYYESSLWREDFQADEAGELPTELKRGVLSEDGLWNLLERARELDEKENPQD